MKRVLAILSLLGTLLLASACHFNVNLSADAWAEVSFVNGDMLRTDVVTYEGFHRNSFSDDDLEHIFVDLTQHIKMDQFGTAVLHLDVFDEIKGVQLRDETYGVVYNSHTGHYDFADMEYDY